MNSHDLMFFTLTALVLTAGLVGLITFCKITFEHYKKPKKVVYILTYPLGSTLQPDGTIIPHSEVATRILNALHEGKDIACSTEGRKAYRLTAMDYKTGETISERYLDP